LLRVQDEAATRPTDDAASRSLGDPVPAAKLIAWALIVSMLGIWTWWALSQGAYFGTVLLPGAVLLYLLVIVTFSLSRLPISGRGPHIVAIVALVGFAAWTLASLLWTPARDLALDYAQRDFAFAAAFGAGLTLAVALRRHVIFSVVPFLGAGAIVVVVMLVKIKTAGDLQPLIDRSGTLEFPFGYRNANAGFLAMVALGSIPMIVRRGRPVVVPALLAFLAATAGSLVVVSQSRGSVLGVAAGCLVLVLVSRRRIATVLTLIAVAAPIALFLPELLDPYETARGADGLRELQQAVTWSIFAGLLAAVLVAILSIVVPRVPVRRIAQPSPAAATAAILATIAAGLLAFTVLVGNPLDSLEDGINEISSGDREYGDIEGSRFTYAGGLSRLNFWEVAIDPAEADPINGGGAGSFRSVYLVEGPGDFEPRNAHSLPLEVLGELGIVGLLLLLTGLGAAAVAAFRSRRHGQDPSVVVATAFVVAAVMLAQAAVDWSWYFGAQAAPMLALLGSAAGPAALGTRPARTAARVAVAIAAGLLAALALPTFVSERLTLEAGRSWRADTPDAYSKLDTAADLNPYTDVPLLLKSAIAARRGDDDVAVAAAREAIARAPENWRGHLLAAEALRDDSAAARAAIERADALNPTNPEVNRIERQLRAGTER